MNRDCGQSSGTVRYVGVTRYVASAHAELERVIRRERPDFLQINYSLAEPGAGDRLLPVARDLGVAVLVNRPLTKGTTVTAGSASTHLMKSWVALWHPSSAATGGNGRPAARSIIVLTGTRNPRHAVENLAAAAGAVPGPAQRSAIHSWFQAL